VDQAADFFGSVPVFWGRYFTSVAATGVVEYRHLRENAVLRAQNVPVLPIARQTKRVNGTAADGASDAEANAEDVITTFGSEYLASQGGQFCVFLDVEGAPSLSLSYYRGWAQTLMAHSRDITLDKVTLLPCVYGTRFDIATWNNVAAAAQQNVPCFGAWVARYFFGMGCKPLPEWMPAVITPIDNMPCTILIWQYAGDCHGNGGYDCNVTNPNIDLDEDLLSHLILPPADEV
jgi:hypothetical protein